MHLICIGTVHEHCTFGSSDEKVRSRCHFAVTTDLNFDLLLGVVCVGVPFSNGSSEIKASEGRHTLCSNPKSQMSQDCSSMKIP